MAGLFARRTFLVLALLPLTAPAQDWIYRVQPGDNPWSLTQKFLDGARYWPRLQQYNNIRDPLRMAPGTVLRMPVAWLRAEPAEARVLAVNGSASVTRMGLAEHPLAPGAGVRAADLLRTAAGATLELQFADGSRLRLFDDSELRIQRHVRFANTDMVDVRVQLLRGRSESLARSVIGTGGRFEIETPAAVTSVRGTHFRVNNSQAESSSELLEGRLQVAGSAAAVNLGPRTGTVVLVGRPPAEPTPLLPAPDLSALLPEVERSPMNFVLPNLAGAIGYRLQIADRADFSTLLHDSVSPTTNLRAQPLPDGDYHLRVRGIDVHRLEGLDAIARVRLNAQPEAPLLMEPPPGARLVEARPTFRWAKVEGADRYHFELASDAGFHAPLIDRADLTGAEFTPAAELPLGAYVWRVTAADRDGRGPRGPAQRLQRIPQPPEMAPPQFGENQIALRWEAAAADVRYRVQVSPDARFASLLLNATTDAPQALLDRPPPGTYHVRVQMLFADGGEGPFGRVQRFEIAAPPEPSRWRLLAPLLLLLLAL